MVRRSGMRACGVALGVGLLASPAFAAEINMIFGQDPFANQFWGVATPAPTPAPAAAPARAATPAAAPAPVAATPIVVAPAPAPVPAPAPRAAAPTQAPLPPPAPVAAAPVQPSAPIAVPPPRLSAQPAPAPVQQAQAAPAPAAPPRAAPAPVEIRPAASLPPKPTFAGPAAGFAVGHTYIGGDLGMATYSAASNSGTNVHNSLEFGTGYGGDILVGFQATPAWALETELNWRTTTPDTITPSGGTAATATGTVSTLGLLVNGVYRLDLRTKLRPYGLIGIGMARTAFTDVAAPGVVTASDSAFAFAYQLGFGATYPLSPRFSLDASYRLFSGGSPALTDTALDEFTTEVMVHNFLIGLRYHL